MAGAPSGSRGRAAGWWVAPSPRRRRADSRRHHRRGDDPQGRVLRRGAARRRQAGARDRRPRPPRASARGADQPGRRHGARARPPPAAAAPLARMTNAETNAEILAASAAHEVGVYARQPVAFVRGRGAELWDADGKRYLDFFAGLAVNNLGHCHPAVVDAVRTQAAELLHASNVYYTAPAAELTRLLCRHSFAERVFLCNSGAEANEAAMKLARRWGGEHDGRYEILATTGSFHGRTFATLTATGQEKYHQGFQPLLPGVRLVPYDDAAAMATAVRDETVAILVEPIQGEGGVNVPRPGYSPRLRDLADRHGLLLIFDEVQCGMGRTGRLFAHEHVGVPPDIMTLAKALGGGLPIGAMCTSAGAAAA